GVGGAAEEGAADGDQAEPALRPALHLDGSLLNVGLDFEEAEAALDGGEQGSRPGGGAIAAEGLRGQARQPGGGGDAVPGDDAAEVAVDADCAQVDAGGVDLAQGCQAVAAVGGAARGRQGHRRAGGGGGEDGQVDGAQLLLDGVVTVDAAGAEGE